MLHGFSIRKNQSTNIEIDGIKIKKVNNCRYLGVIIDEELKWIEHIQQIRTKLVKYCSTFYKFRHKIPLQIRKNIYLAFVHPHLL